MLSAIILAAGSARRMGRQKLLLPLGDDKIIERTVKTVKASKGFDEILLIYKDAPLRKIAEGCDILPIYNENACEGIASSIRAGVQNAGRDTDAFMFFCGDQPFISKKMIFLLIHAYKTSKAGNIIVPRYEGRRGMPTIFPVLWKEKLLSLQGDSGGRSITAAYPDHISWVDMPESEGSFDIDTETDYSEAQIRLSNI